MATSISILPIHLRLLMALNTYRLLTYAMMRQVGVALDREDVAEAARFLYRKGLVARTENVLVVRVTALPRMYWLTPQGAAALNKFDPAHQARGAERRFGDMHEVKHRVGLVEFHIALRAWLANADGCELVGFTADFEPGSAGFRKATTIKGAGFKISPDALVQVMVEAEAEPRFLVVELERGGEVQDLSPFWRHKLPHLRSICAGQYLENHFRLPKLVRFLVVFPDAALRASALARWPDPGAREWQRFFINSLPELAADCGGAWFQPDGSRRPLFQLDGPSAAQIV